MGKTTLTNKLGSNVLVTKGNSNILREHPTLEPGKAMTIQADSRATYYEYVLYKLPDNKKLGSFSSDDIQRLFTIEIPEDFVLKEFPREIESFPRKLTSAVIGMFSSKAEPAKGGAPSPLQENPREEIPYEENPFQEIPGEEISCEEIPRE